VDACCRLLLCSSCNFALLSVNDLYRKHFFVGIFRPFLRLNSASQTIQLRLPPKSMPHDLRQTFVHRQSKTVASHSAFVLRPGLFQRLPSAIAASSIVRCSVDIKSACCPNLQINRSASEIVRAYGRKKCMLVEISALLRANEI